jgi:hypothetical protein
MLDQINLYHMIKINLSRLQDKAQSLSYLF